MFHERAGEVKEKYLDRLDDERYQMKPEVETQRKVEALFADVTDEKELWLRDGLYALISDVLLYVIIPTLASSIHVSQPSLTLSTSRSMIMTRQRSTAFTTTISIAATTSSGIRRR